MVLITNLAGDQAGEGAFSQKTPKNAKKTPFLYLKNRWTYELRFHLILTGIGTFYSELLVLQTFYKRNKLKTPKTAQKTPFIISRTAGPMTIVYPHFNRKRHFLLRNFAFVFIKLTKDGKKRLKLLKRRLLSSQKKLVA